MESSEVGEFACRELVCRWDIWTRKESNVEGVSPPKLGILCHGCELLGFVGKKKNVSSIHMNNVLKEQSRLGSPDGSGGGREEV